MPILSPYTYHWITSFNLIKTELQLALAGIDFVIEHVGSTAVPNLDAKPIIDIDIIFKEKETFDLIKLKLESIGYYHNGNQGIEDREVFKRLLNKENSILDTISHHLYVCPVFSKALERHLLLRNHLQKNDAAKLQYQEIKYKLAIEAKQDRKKYAALKELHINDFIDVIIENEKAGY